MVGDRVTLAIPSPHKLVRGDDLIRGIVISYLSLIVLLPLAAILWRSSADGTGSFWRAISSPQVVAALQLSLLTSVIVVAINAVAGTVIAWVLARDSFWGKEIVDAVIDLPFALPTIVTGLTLLTLYGPQSPFGVNVAYTRVGIILALLFVTLPFAVRAVQPVLAEIDREMEDAAKSLGASGFVTFRHIILPALLPAILSGAALGFARSIGEFGAVVLISGNIPFQTEVATVNIFGLIESDRVASGAAVSVVLLAISLG
ncbi:MAG TPA: sulfate ABC transporter permease subunit CysT, partial [Nitrolancea sp.]|nr:sulfate ABC transporter permease subunit CysT [Nitrolancea sp.]